MTVSRFHPAAGVHDDDAAIGQLSQGMSFAPFLASRCCVPSRGAWQCVIACLVFVVPGLLREKAYEMG